MSDLHARLLAAVRQRMDVARAAGSTSRHSARMVGRYADWHAEPYYTSEDVPYSVVVQPPLGQIVPASMETRIAEHIAANDPATVLRHCERDLAVLERHQAIHMSPPVACQTCCDRHGVGAPPRSMDVAWPCPEITDMAAAYGVDVDGG